MPYAGSYHGLAIEELELPARDVAGKPKIELQPLSIDIVAAFMRSST